MHEKNTKQNVFEIENNNKSPEKVQRLNKTEIYFFPGRDYVLNRRGSGIRSDYCYQFSTDCCYKCWFYIIFTGRSEEQDQIYSSFFLVYLILEQVCCHKRVQGYILYVQIQLSSVVAQHFLKLLGFSSCFFLTHYPTQ